MQKIYAKIAGTGSYLPEKILHNQEITKFIDSSDEWIFTRTGIKERHIIGDGETNSDMAFNAVQQAIRSAGISAQNIDLIIYATTTPDRVFPSTACILQNKLGINCPAFDVQAVCSGFVYAMTIANNFIQNQQAKYVLVIGSDAMSRITDWHDRSNCMLWGDGAGAVILQASDTAGILSTHIYADAQNYQWLLVDEAEKIRMQGSAVFKIAVNHLNNIVDEVLISNNLKESDIDWLIPHQANVRILESTAKKLKMDMAKVIVTIDRHGNTSAGSIPLALDEAIKDGRIKRGQTLLMEAFGSGFTWGAVLLKF